MIRLENRTKDEELGHIDIVIDIIEYNIRSIDRKNVYALANLVKDSAIILVESVF